ncbi:DNA end-binding protein Ku [Paenibacillus shirakamiensis]|uniref:Non-homologous end joining protein Ku n=1 Tax=Paenibacillus shirakamiensis TaxID=1265935 RepID=A0ABS4JF42_9BACL|nr:Ku protein [Paenibacillus shirakamiensis]MBP2000318.1 DNA end-binding protein Ku [Paenibacillus shirakamiensis]
MQTIWKGSVSFGLVNVPVKMFTATEDNDVHMKMLHKDSNAPIQYHRTCPKCEEDVSWSEIVKGYEYEPGHYVTFDKKELDDLAMETSREIKIVDFVDLEEIDPIYYQKTYYLSPEKNGEHAYNLLVRALEDTDKIGIAHVSIRSKSSLAAVRIIDGVLSMTTMFYAEEIRPKDEIPNLPDQPTVDDRELDMAKMLINQLASTFEPDRYEDLYKTRLMDAIEDKVEGKEVKMAPEEKKTNVIDLMEALKASLGQSKDVKPNASTSQSSSTTSTRSSKSKVLKSSNKNDATSEKNDSSDALAHKKKSSSTRSTSRRSTPTQKKSAAKSKASASPKARGTNKRTKETTRTRKTGS